MNLFSNHRYFCAPAAVLTLALLAVACSGSDGVAADIDPAPDRSGGTTEPASGDVATGDASDPAVADTEPAPSANGGILDDRECGPDVDDVLFFTSGEDLNAVSSTGDVLWTAPGGGAVEQNTQGRDWVILRNGEVFDFTTGTVERNSDLTNPGGILPDCRAVYLVSPQSLVGHDGTLAWQADSGMPVVGRFEGTDEGVLVFAREVDIDETLALADGVPVDNLVGLAGDGSVVWSRTEKGDLRYANGVIGIGQSDAPTVWFDGATGNELFSTEARFNQIIECGETLWFHVRGNDGFGLEVRQAQTGELLYENEQVLRAATGYDGYGDASYYAEGTSAGYQIGDQLTFVPDCSRPDQPAWTATARVANDIVITDDVVYAPESRTVIDRASGEILIAQTEEYGRHSSGDAIVAYTERDGVFGLAFLEPRTFTELAFIPGPEDFLALRVPNWADPAVLRLSRPDDIDRVIDARSGEVLIELE